MASPSDTAALWAEAATSAPVLLDDALIALPVALQILLAAILLLVEKRPRLQAILAVAGLGAVFAVDLALLADVLENGPRIMAMGAWRPPFGIVFSADALGTTFLAVAGFTALACAVYATAAIPREERRGGFFPFLVLMMAGVSGAFLTGDLFNLYVWFEVLLIASFGLLALGSRPAQLDGALAYGILNLVATTFFLIATALTYGLFGTLNMAHLARLAAERGADGLVIGLSVLFLAAFGMKAAAFPVNAWLPASYHTPRFVTSALFAGLLTKVGVYALIRVLGMVLPAAHDVLTPLIAGIAGLTMMIGALGALAQSDIRRLLNYVVVAGIGTILAGLAVPIAPGAAGLAGAIAYAIHSILVMAALYLAAGVAANRTGSSSLHEMGGLWKRFPVFSGLVFILVLAVSGLPPLSGFWPKLVLLRATLADGETALAAILLLSGLLLTLAMMRVFALAFWRDEPARESPAEAEDFTAALPSRWQTSLPLAALTLLVVLLGLVPEPLARLSRIAADGIADPAAVIRLTLGDAP
ncbi:cation:proton antiporter [Aureimonas sp. Leaf454]|uniref:Na+/H+ antiporter subunit D n=1 Tax=Aureimonas sp. Leaf454 TaxID=1736381 RepID=UPI0006F343DA|nr:Na+/H+ antiporter subunit D [Aureimonas sp. Leaf454]KQT45216.1 cation:proton antiporter [Aureimonas sp. Leaf454]